MKDTKKPLPMTDEEILREYREAADPCKQVKILAELNATSVERIIEILVAQGVDRRRLPRRRGESAQKAPKPTEDYQSLPKPTDAPTETPTEAPQTEAVPVEIEAGEIAKGIALCVGEIVDALKARRAELSDRISALTEALDAALAEAKELDRLAPILLRCQEEVQACES